jgi:hypothetical protein
VLENFGNGPAIGRGPLLAIGSGNGVNRLAKRGAVEIEVLQELFGRERHKDSV